MTPGPKRSRRWPAPTAQARAGRLARGRGEAPRRGQCAAATAVAAPPASYLHVADDGLEEASKRAAFLLNHSLHFPSVGKERTHTGGRLGCERDRAHSPREEIQPRATHLLEARSLFHQEDKITRLTLLYPK